MGAYTQANNSASNFCVDCYAFAFIRSRMTRYEALKAARNTFPSEQAMADALGVSQPTIWRWLNQSKQMPAEYVLRTEDITGVARHHLRPDIYPRDCMVDRQAGLLRGQNDVAPFHDGQNSTRYLGVDFNRGSRLKEAAR